MTLTVEANTQGSISPEREDVVRRTSTAVDEQLWRTEGNASDRRGSVQWQGQSFQSARAGWEFAFGATMTRAQWTVRRSCLYSGISFVHQTIGHLASELLWNYVEAAPHHHGNLWKPLSARDAARDQNLRQKLSRFPSHQNMLFWLVLVQAVSRRGFAKKKAAI